MVCYVIKGGKEELYVKQLMDVMKISIQKASSLGASLYMDCTHHLRCSEADRIRWSELREHVHNLVELGKVAREDGYITESVLISNSSPINECSLQ